MTPERTTPAGALSWRESLLLALVAIALLVLFSRPAFDQDPTYHGFADQRMWLGIPHFFDVMSNLPFMLVGLSGLWLCRRLHTVSWRLPWQVFFLAVALVSAGSGYYHWSPNNWTLVWDRLPMTVGFMALVMALLAEHVSVRVAQLLLWPAMVLGMTSVWYWYFFHDLRWYYFIQLAPMLMIVGMLTLFPARYSHRSLLLLTLVLYGLAKYAEYHDREIYALLGLSGHTLKHVLAAAGCAGIGWMLWVRQPVPEASRLQNWR